MAHRPQFNINLPLVAATAFVFAGEPYEKGDPFPKNGKPGSFNVRLIKRQYEARKVDHAEGGEAAAGEETTSLVTMTGPKGGRYTISAPWLDEDEVVRGKVNAEKRVAELTEAGPPLGWIEGGSEVTVEGGEGGWYEVNAPWLDEPEKVQGREAAEARQREIHDAGAPTAADEGGEGGEAPDANETKSEAGEGADAGEGDDAGAPGAGTGEGSDEGAQATEGDDPQRTGAETIPGTGPAQAADDVEAAAGGKPAGD